MFSERDEACAYCKRMSKSGCTAKATEPPPPPPSPMEETRARLASFDERLDFVTAALKQSVERADALEERIIRNEAYIIDLENHVAELRDGQYE